ncbi:MAG: glycosyltransferase family 39 protein, partial [Anaerolineae bacterium]
MENHHRRAKLNRGEWFLVIVLLLLLFAQTTTAINRTSLTIDEGLHIASGYSILRTGDYRLIEEHPPLTKYLMAWPLLLVPDLPDPSGLPAWEMDTELTDSLRLVRMSQELIYGYQPLDRLVFAARLPVALLAVLLAALVFRWATDWFGPRGGLLALFILAFDPNILAHGGVATTDLGAACFISMALYTFQRFLRQPTQEHWLLAGLTLGMAQAAKLSAMLLLPTQGLLILVYGLRRHQSPANPKISDLKTYSLAYAGMVVLAAWVLWALYGFETGPVAESELTLPAASHAIPWLRLLEHAQGGHAAFLLGQVSHQGWWYYFPVALALKTPLPVLFSWLAALAALAHSWWAKKSSPPMGRIEGGQGPSWPEELALLLFPLLYLVASLQSSLNIGYRH